MTELLAVAALLLLFGSYLVLRAVMDADTDESAAPMRGAARESRDERRAA